MNNIHQLSFNAEKAKKRGFKWFAMLIVDYHKRGIISKPTQKEIKEIYEILTDITLTKSEVTAAFTNLNKNK